MSQWSDEPKKPGSEGEHDIDFLNGSSRRAESESRPPIDSETADYIARIEMEIEAEVKSKRSQGAFPPAFERRLKTIFEQLVPPGAGNSRRDFEALLRSSDRAAYFDIDVPIASQKPGVARLKKLLRMTQAWYLNYLAQQLNNFSTNLMRLLYVFDARVTKLEKSADSRAEVRSGGEFLKPCYPDMRETDGPVLQLMGQHTSRVLVADCGDGYLVARLRESGVDCYGIDSFGDDLEKPFAPHLDLRWQELREHFEEISNGALSGILLQGSIDLLPANEKLDLATEAGRTLCPSGVLAVLSIDPVFFDSSPDLAVQRDVAPGRPFAAETWQFVFSRLGFSSISVTKMGNSNLISGLKQGEHAKDSAARP